MKKTFDFVRRMHIPFLWIVVFSQVFMIVVIFSATTYLLAKEDVASDGTPLAVVADTISGLEQRVLSALPVIPTFHREAALVAAIIENHEDARAAQAGLSDAEVVFEMIAEGDITRFLALFRSDRLPQSIGPVRSLRLHFVSVLDPYHPLLLHIGGHPLAYDALHRSSTILDHDGIRFDGQTFQRSKEFSAPHNLFMGKDALSALLKKEEASLPKIPFPLFSVSRNVTGESSGAKKIFVNFGSPLHDVTFTYNNWRKEYQRSTDGAPEQASPTNVLILETLVEGYGVKGAIPWTNTYGGGKMLLFRNGKRIEGTWKRSEGKPFSFLDSEGNLLPLAPGKSWITFLPSLRAVTTEE